MKFIFPSLSRHIISSVSDDNLFTSYILFIFRHLALTMHCHGDGKQQKAKTTTIKWLCEINVSLVGLIIICKTTNIFAHTV